MDTQPTRGRVAFIGALHGVGAFVACALVLCAIAVAVAAAGSKTLNLPVIFAIIVLVAFAHFGVYALPIAAGIGALVASSGRPKRAARRVWFTVAPLTLLFPIGFLAVTAMQAR